MASPADRDPLDLQERQPQDDLARKMWSVPTATAVAALSDMGMTDEAIARYYRVDIASVHAARSGRSAPTAAAQR